MRFAPLSAMAALLMLAIALPAAGPAFAVGARAARIPAPVASTAPFVGVSEDSHVPKGEVHEGDLVSIMGDVVIEGEVTGQVVVVMGSIDLSGTVQGDVVSVMSRTHLATTARVGGELVSVGWSMVREPGSRIEGETINIGFMNLMPFVGNGGGLSGFLRFLFILHLISLAVLFLMMLVITALVPRRLSVIAAAFPQRWGWALLAGLLAWCCVWIGVFILAVTIIGLPLAFALWYVTKAIKWIGLASIFYLTGQTAGRNLFRRELPHLACVLGGFVVYALLTLVPFIGSIFTMLMSILALGIALLTRLGAEPVAQGLGQPVVPVPPAGGAPRATTPPEPAGASAPPVY